MGEGRRQSNLIFLGWHQVCLPPFPESFFLEVCGLDAAVLVVVRDLDDAVEILYS